MRHLAITGIVTASWISRILSGSAMRARPLLIRIVPVSAIAVILAWLGDLTSRGGLRALRDGRRRHERASACARLLRRLLARGLYARRHEGAPPARQGFGLAGVGERRRRLGLTQRARVCRAAGGARRGQSG